MSQFVDQAKIYVAAGNGGDGAATFRREAHVAQGGPSGGDGGRGGNVIFVADVQLGTLLDFKYKQHYRAQHGENGRPKDQYGAGGDDLIVRVPIGTVATDLETGDVLADFTEDGQSIVVCQGGTGGLGNIHFKTPWNQAPTKATKGVPGEQRTIRLELKLMADVGLLGFPNVGKSTFISVVSRAKPKIGDYPFTTLTPKLGVVKLSGDRTIVLADIPGLIKNASQGAGLGHQFLRHLERTRVLVHLLECSYDPERKPETDYETLRVELENYDEKLAKSPEIVVLNKMDLSETQEALPRIQEYFDGKGIKLWTISTATREGMDALMDEVYRVMAAAKAKDHS